MSEGPLDTSHIRWDLNGCCETEEYLYISLYIVYNALIYWFWRRDWLKPLKLLGVFVHGQSSCDCEVLDDSFF